MNDSIKSAYNYHRHICTPMSAKSAIALARVDVVGGVNRYPYFPNKKSPRPIDGKIWVERPDCHGLRFVGYADEITGSHTIGYYTDCFQDSTTRGVVYQLPSHNGELRLLAGYSNSDDDGVLFDLDVYRDANKHGDHVKNSDAAQTVARNADSFAERAAEKEREYQTACEHGRQFSELGAEISDLRKSVISDIQDLRFARNEVKDQTAPHWLSLCDKVRRSIRHALNEIETLKKKRQLIASGDYIDDFFTGFYGRAGQDAFNEGAGL